MNIITTNSKIKATILGLAYADALGAGYEFFKGQIGEDEEIDFLEVPKITVHKKYEWTDDTAMTYLTMCSMQPSQNKGRPYLEINYELLSDLFIDWYKGAPDKGIHTYNVLSQTEYYKKINPNEQRSMFTIAKAITEANPMSAGNGGLMRIAAGLIPLKHSDDNDWDVIRLASELNDLTHPHPDSNSSCRFFLYLLNLLVKEHEKIKSKEEFSKFISRWTKELEAFGTLGNSVRAAFTCDLNSLNPNRYVITTLSLAIGSIYQTWEEGITPKEHFINTVHKCIRVGDDTDTTSAVAGAMVGAIYGEECLPNDIDKIYGYAGEQYTHVTYEDMVKTIDELL